MKIPGWMLKIHIYGGLLCFWYLIIFGISSLYYQHHFPFMQNQQISKGTEQSTLALDDIPSEDAALAIQLMDSLDIAGWHLFWRTHRDSLGHFRTQVENPKMSYVIDYHTKTGKLEVSKTYKGFWGVVNSLHALGELPNAPWIILWKIYTYVCVVVVLFSTFSGVWLWAKKRSEKRIGWIVFSLSLGISIFLITYVYFYG